ncbi:hypothetical protein GE09DRAFT_1159267 [Coniochaeta sp. 2T2.1]|nr:hypothetical protein GE09DRAFT_1159267 [Coniochaeta sp. 2T2.1]
MSAARDHDSVNIRARQRATADVTERLRLQPPLQHMATILTMPSRPTEEKARTGRQPGRRRITRPEQGSLYDIMHDHVSTPLYLKPISWVDKHAQLLGVRFHERQRILCPHPGTAVRSLERSRVAGDIADNLSALFSAANTTSCVAKSEAVKQVMKTIFPATLSHPESNAELHLYIGNRVYQKVVRAPVLWGRADDNSMSFDINSAVTQPATPPSNIPDTSMISTGPHMSSRPLLAYLDKEQCKALRSNLYRVSSGPIRGDQANTPVQCLARLRSKQLLPSEEDKDAYYVAIMLAMAQSHIYGAAGSTPRPGPRSGGGNFIDNPPTSFTNVNVRLLTHSEETAELIVYEAEVTSTFLSRFANPTKSPSQDTSGPGLDITFNRIPVWPVLGLKERLAQALGSEIAGKAARKWEEKSNFIETWRDAEERRIGEKTAAMGGDHKRRREEYEGDAKRRCTHTGRPNPLEAC